MDEDIFKKNMDCLDRIHNTIKSMNDDIKDILDYFNKDKIEKLEKRKKVIKKIIKNE